MTDSEIDKLILTNANLAGKKAIQTPQFNSFIEAVDWSTMFLGFKSETALALSEKSPVQMDLGFRSIQTFDGAIIVGSGHDVNGYDEKYSIKPIENDLVNLRDLNFDLSGAKYYSISANPNQEDHKGPSLGKIRLLTDAELKGTPHAGRYILEYSQSRLMENETWFNYRVYFWMLPGGKNAPDRFSTIGSLKTPKAKFEEGETAIALRESMQSVLKAQFANHYQWFAYFKEADSVGFRVPISPESCKDVFELRDVPESGRKKAMLHWVSQHYRKIKTGDFSQEYRDTLVKRHLRGENKFDWRGFQVHLIPAKYDIVRCGSKKKFLSIQ